MLSIMIAQITLAAAAALGVSNAPTSSLVPVPAVSAATPTPPRATNQTGKTTKHTRVTAGLHDRTALDILNDTRRDILGRGASRHCPPVKAVYVNGERRLAPAVDHGFSRATLYFAGDTVMIMLPPSVADALRTIPAQKVQDIHYVDCRDGVVGEDQRDVLYIAAK